MNPFHDLGVEGTMDIGNALSSINSPQLLLANSNWAIEEIHEILKVISDRWAKTEYSLWGPKDFQ